jgi:hypothetical protein
LVVARTLRPDVAVVAALADPGRAVLIPPRLPFLADATLLLAALTHLGDYSYMTATENLEAVRTLVALASSRVPVARR